ncbi:hypothetical protein GBAR_LOCUS26291 [Geodia barretti]|uniref:Uncharacterized protein n=1 Tax=Geodia barretti TaxID=519541 RepID=A0AA35TFW8_GEOBA|nr:hypothetical protein GBAR_LOCUS26291 [Geodia barretti]
MLQSCGVGLPLQIFCIQTTRDFASLLQSGATSPS